jgi:hypothetical protein
MTISLHLAARAASGHASAQNGRVPTSSTNMAEVLSPPARELWRKPNGAGSFPSTYRLFDRLLDVVVAIFHPQGNAPVHTRPRNTTAWAEVALLRQLRLVPSISKEDAITGACYSAANRNYRAGQG